MEPASENVDNKPSTTVLKANNERKCEGFVWFSRKKKKKGSEKCYAGQAILKDMLKHAKDIHFSTIRNKPITFCLFFSREPNRK